MPLYTFDCYQHGEFDVFFRMNDKKSAFCRCGLPAKRVYTAPQVAKDQLYNFRLTNTGKPGAKPVDIYSKDQLKRVCRQLGLVQVTKDDLFTRGNPIQPDSKISPSLKKEIEMKFYESRKQMTQEKLKAFGKKQQEAIHAAAR